MWKLSTANSNCFYFPRQTSPMFWFVKRTFDQTSVALGWSSVQTSLALEPSKMSRLLNPSQNQWEIMCTLSEEWFNKVLTFTLWILGELVSDYHLSKSFGVSATLYAMPNISTAVARRSSRHSRNMKQVVQIQEKL